MAKVKTYDVVYNGMRTRMKLTEEDAKRLGVAPQPEPNEPAETTEKPASTKKRTAKNKATDSDGD